MDMFDVNGLISTYLFVALRSAFSFRCLALAKSRNKDYVKH